MNVEVVSIEKARQYSLLDYFEKLWMLELPGYVALAVTDGARGQKHLGVMIYKMTPRAFTIEWLCVSEEYRGRGVGETLLEAALSQALERKQFVLNAHIIESRKSRKLCPSQVGYLVDHFFEKDVDVTGSWTTDPDNLMQAIANNAAYISFDGKYTILSSLDGRHVTGIIDNFNKRQDVFRLISADTWREPKNREISVVCVGEGKLLGLALFTRLHNRVCLTGLYADDVKIFVGLLRNAGREIEKKCGSNTTIHLFLSGDRYVGMLEKLAESKMVPGKIVAADTSVFAAAHDYVDDPDYDLLDAFFDAEGV